MVHLERRNARSFNDCEKTSLDLQLCFLKSLFEWISVNALLDVSNFVGFCALFFLYLILLGVSNF